MPRRLPLYFILFVLLAAGCSDDPTPRDPSGGAVYNISESTGADRDASTPRDTGEFDASQDVEVDTPDAEETDTEETDTEETDTQETDTSCSFLNDPSCPLDCTDADTWPESWLNRKVQLLDLINLERSQGAECGFSTMPSVEPVSLNPELTEAARCHSQDMSENEFLSQEGSNGQTFSDRAAAAGYTGNAHSQSIGGSPLAENMVQNWMGSFAFCNNIMRADTTEIGVGFANINVNRWTMIGGQ